MHREHAPGPPGHNTNPSGVERSESAAQTIAAGKQEHAEPRASVPHVDVTQLQETVDAHAAQLKTRELKHKIESSRIDRERKALADLEAGFNQFKAGWDQLTTLRHERDEARASEQRQQ